MTWMVHVPEMATQDATRLCKRKGLVAFDPKICEDLTSTEPEAMMGELKPNAIACLEGSTPIGASASKIPHFHTTDQQ